MSLKQTLKGLVNKNKKQNMADLEGLDKQLVNNIIEESKKMAANGSVGLVYSYVIPCEYDMSNFIELVCEKVNVELQKFGIYDKNSVLRTICHGKSREYYFHLYWGE